MITLPACQPASLSDVQIAELEWKVVEAAVNLKLLNRASIPAHAPYHAYTELMDAVDALIAAREQVEKQ